MDPVALEEELRKDRKGNNEPPEMAEDDLMNDTKKDSVKMTVDAQPRKQKDDPSLQGILPAN